MGTCLICTAQQGTHNGFKIFLNGPIFEIFMKRRGFDTSTVAASTQWYLKSNSLQYNALACWVDGTNDSSTKCLMFQALFFFIISYRLRALKTLYFKFYIIIKNKKINWNDFCFSTIPKLLNRRIWNTILLYINDSLPVTL